jgi:hypothetical protein
MYFAARAAGTGIAHFPKVVLFIAEHNMVFSYQLFPFL